MKKSITTNLGGTIFYIDEDALAMLKDYLSNLEELFRLHGEDADVVRDFELRISELLSDATRDRNYVVDIDRVREVIERMGRPDQIFGEDGESMASPSSDFTKQHAAPGAASTSSGESIKRKYYRDPEHAILCGVLSGLSVYTGFSLTALRVLFCLVLFFGVPFRIPSYMLIVPYFLVWMMVPEATSVPQKLKMTGQNLSVEAVGEQVIRREYTVSGIWGRVGKLLAGGCLSLIVLSVLGIFLGLLIVPAIEHYPTKFWGAYAGRELPLVLASISMLILVGMPFLSQLYSAIFVRDEDRDSLPRLLQILMLLLWICALVYFLYCSIVAMSLPFTWGWH